ncbi:MAG: hypothetical protein LUE89_06315 [Clostridiales bacterium]|nr:hypothetical protein [Clostridiales bacterium]
MDGAGVTTENVKQWLLRFLDGEHAIDVQIERLERLEARIEGTGSPNLDGMPRGSPNHDRVASMLAQKEEFENKIRSMITAQADRRRMVEQYVDRLRKPDEKAVIEMRYLDGERWKDISQMLFGSKADFADREDSFLRRTTRLHERALINLVAVMGQDPPEDLPTDGEVEF